jgi:hypothetical protein
MKHESMKPQSNNSLHKTHEAASVPRSRACRRRLRSLRGGRVKIVSREIWLVMVIGFLEIGH